MDREFLRTDELTDILGKSRTTLYRWARQGDIPRALHGMWHLPSVREAIKKRMRVHPGFSLPDPDPEPEIRKDATPCHTVPREAPRIVQTRGKK